MNVVKPENLFVFFPDGDWYGEALRDFFHEHGARAAAGPARGPWFWDERGATEACLDAAWDMLGKWQARRAVRVDPACFVKSAPRPIQILAETLNCHRVDSLRTLAARDGVVREAVARAVFRAVEAVSRIKPTQTLSPMFGSKVVHHYFPSVVPAFDDAKIRRTLMRSVTWQRATSAAARAWRRHAERAGTFDRAMGDFQRYFAYCAAQIEDAPAESLWRTREVLGARCVPFAPPALQNDTSSLLWRLDAKVAEFCGCGAAQAAVDEEVVEE